MLPNSRGSENKAAPSPFRGVQEVLALSDWLGQRKPHRPDGRDTASLRTEGLHWYARPVPCFPWFGKISELIHEQSRRLDLVFSETPAQCLLTCRVYRTGKRADMERAVSLIQAAFLKSELCKDPGRH